VSCITELNDKINDNFWNIDNTLYDNNKDAFIFKCMQSHVSMSNDLDHTL